MITQREFDVAEQDAKTKAEKLFSEFRLDFLAGRAKRGTDGSRQRRRGIEEDNVQDNPQDSIPPKPVVTSLRAVNAVPKPVVPPSPAVVGLGIAGAGALNKPMVQTTAGIAGFGGRNQFVNLYKPMQSAGIAGAGAANKNVNLGQPVNSFTGSEPKGPTYYPPYTGFGPEEAYVPAVLGGGGTGSGGGGSGGGGGGGGYSYGGDSRAFFSMGLVNWRI